MVLWRMHVELEDRPGRLGELATVVGDAGCNIISLHVVGEPSDDGSVIDELLVEVPDDADTSAVVHAVERAGIPCTLLVRADATELSDPVTTALALARMVAADPGSAPRAVATMLRARLADPAAPPRNGHTHTLRVGAQQVHLRRAWPFTATELSRAAALMELAGQLGMRLHGAAEPDGRRVLLHDGSEVRLRTARPSDGPLIAALHARCSPESRRSRFLSPTPRLSPDRLADLVGDGPGAGRAVLALTVDGGSAVGLANLGGVATPSGVAVLVEDSWHGRGLGTALIRRIVELAQEHGHAELTAVAPTDNVRLTRLLRRAGLRPTAEIVAGQLFVRAPLARPAPAA
ncbi:GNAT family N-acetyltransferase [Pseudonocardia bannensis]|uniref:GNAT family N-acetyltransferase n=1 Tax=Pseudonocardia bannensis TaxID=630973 RepID=A0A848DDG5_9PSEU|nr:GNAT family N-acetyltransferase [Pseudonocardia bannensis]NMH90641.1 GNAT family N-acetyltransferase [Pseudonocardia bannensis]